jgi:hypothetical protein
MRPITMQGVGVGVAVAAATSAKSATIVIAHAVCDAPMCWSTLGAFATESGKELGWHATLSEHEFKLPPCGEKTVLVTVTVDCAKLERTPGDTERSTPAAVDSCVVAYATLRAEGCTIRPLVIAVAVLPNDCGAHHAGCQCGCCCC